MYVVFWWYFQGRLYLDLVLLDLYLDRTPVLAAISQLSNEVPVLVVSASRTPADVLAAMQAGAGYLAKNASEEAYATAIRRYLGPQ